MTEPDISSPDDNAGVTVPPPFIYVGVLVIALAVDWLLAGPGFGLPLGLRIAIAALLLCGGLTLALSAGARFNAAKTNIAPWMPVTAIVTTGVYRYTRNPMYLSLALMYAGLSLLANSVIGLAGLLVALVIMQYGVIFREERYLEAKFGEAYRAYRRRVPRWIGFV